MKISVIGDGLATNFFIKYLVENKLGVTHFLIGPEYSKEQKELAENMDERAVLDIENVAKGIERVGFSGFIDLRQVMRSIESDYYIVANFGRKIPLEIVKEFHGQLLNIHPSRLPEYAGSAEPIIRMMEAGRKDGCVSVHLVGEQIDKGDVLGQRDFELDYKKIDEESVAFNHIKAFSEAAKLCAEILNR
jgi:folate-dependent phosphoribosylglycinamide formyltransferase PurN